jgi:hypothetical protein
LFNIAVATGEKQMQIQYHVQRALAERLVAVDASQLGPAAIHVALAEMHEQAAATDVNQSLAPFEHSQAWDRFAR